MTKSAFDWKKTLISRRLDLNLRKKLVKCYIWSTAFCGVETWTLRKVDLEYWKSFENVVQEKDGDELDRSCEKCGNITWSQGGEEYHIYNTNEGG